MTKKKATKTTKKAPAKRKPARLTLSQIAKLQDQVTSLKKRLKEARAYGEGINHTLGEAIEQKHALEQERDAAIEQKRALERKLFEQERQNNDPAGNDPEDDCDVEEDDEEFGEDPLAPESTPAESTPTPVDIPQS